MAVITISRELGSGGADIGQLVAKSSATTTWTNGTIDGIFRQYGLTKFDDLYNFGAGDPGYLQSDQSAHHLDAQRDDRGPRPAWQGRDRRAGRVCGSGRLCGCVECSDRGACFGSGATDHGPRDLATLQEAKARIAEDDSIRSKFVHTFYNKQWNEKANFDLVLDTSAFSNDMAAKQIVDAVKALEQKSLATDAVTTASIKIDPVLADAVAKIVAYPLAALSE